jgi:hypothetical protein
VVRLRDLPPRRGAAVAPERLARALPKRAVGRQPAGRLVLSERERFLLPEIAWAGFMTTGQIERLAFPSRRRAQRRLRLLLDHGFLRARLQGGALHRDLLWTVGPRGLALLRDEGLISEGAKSCRPNAYSQKLGHAIAVRDVAVSFLCAKRAGLLEVIDLRIDSELANRSPFRESGIVPDGLAALGDAAARRLVMWEVNREGQPLAQVRAKLLAYLRVRPAGTSLFASPGLIVLVVTENARRLANLLALITDLGADGLIRGCRLEEAVEAASLAAFLTPEGGGFRALA